jgi:putative nucleotidyltransferase with HDIG domain
MEKARLLVDKVGELPPIPGVILESMTLLNDPSVTVKRIQEQILLDQALTSFILKVANSALYGLRREVSTITYAINLMGYNTTKSILLAYLTKNLYRTKGSKMIQTALWKHAIASAVYGKKIAELHRHVNVEEAFIAALLHDIGKSVLLKNRTEEFEEIVTEEYNSDVVSVIVEMKKLEYTHIEVGYILMSKWRFAENIIESLIYHHNIQEYYGDNPLVAIVSLANKLSHINGYAFRTGERDLFETQILNLRKEQVEELQQRGKEEIEVLLEVVG